MAASNTANELHTLRLRVNGQLHTLEVESRESLLDVLRERLGLTGEDELIGRDEPPRVIVGGGQAAQALADGDRAGPITGMFDFSDNNPGNKKLLILDPLTGTAKR